MTESASASLAVKKWVPSSSLQKRKTGVVGAAGAALTIVAMSHAVTVISGNLFMIGAPDGYRRLGGRRGGV
jgi:hypothetical protein